MTLPFDVRGAWPDLAAFEPDPLALHWPPRRHSDDWMWLRSRMLRACAERAALVRRVDTGMFYPAIVLPGGPRLIMRGARDPGMGFYDAVCHCGRAFVPFRQPLPIQAGEGLFYPLALLRVPVQPIGLFSWWGKRRVCASPTLCRACDEPIRVGAPIFHDRTRGNVLGFGVVHERCAIFPPSVRRPEHRDPQWFKPSWRMIQKVPKRFVSHTDPMVALQAQWILRSREAQRRQKRQEKGAKRG